MKKLLQSLIIGVIITSCNTPEPPSKEIPPIVSENASFNFDDWDWTNKGWFFNEANPDEPPFFALTGENYFWELKSSFYTTLNNIYALSGTGIFPPGPITAEKDAGYSGKEGDYSIKLVSKLFELDNIFIPGVVGTILVNLDGYGTDRLALFGRKHSTNDNLITGYYKYEPVGNDDAAIWVDIWKWNNVNMKRDTLGSSRIRIGNKPGFNYPATSSWKEFEAPIVYRAGKENIQPDSINVLFVSSSNFNFSDLFGCKGELGSTLWIDEVVISKKQQ